MIKFANSLSFRKLSKSESTLTKKTDGVIILSFICRQTLLLGQITGINLAAQSLKFMEVVMNRLKTLLKAVLMFVVYFVLFQNVGAQSRTDRILTDEAQRITKDNFSFSAKTANGARIFAVNKATTQMLTAIDKGLTDLFAIARKNGYAQKLNYSDYTIFIAKADRVKNADKKYSPDIAIGAAQYAGSVYDQGGFVYAAGMVLAFKPWLLLSRNIQKNLGASLTLCVTKASISSFITTTADFITKPPTIAKAADIQS